MVGKYKGTVLRLGIGCFVELSAGLNGVCTFIARSRIFAWSDLILDRSHKPVGLQSPAACATRVGGVSGPNFENCDLFHAQSPDTGHGAHWRANRDVDFRR